MGSITLKNKVGQTIYIVDSFGNLIPHNYEYFPSTPLEKIDNDTYKYTGGNKVIENFIRLMKKLKLKLTLITLKRSQAIIFFIR